MVRPEGIYSRESVEDGLVIKYNTRGLYCNLTETPKFTEILEEYCACSWGWCEAPVLKEYSHRVLDIGLITW